MFYTLVLGGKSGGVQQNKFINRVLVWAVYAQELIIIIIFCYGHNLPRR